ncbi:DUF4339 domain-containing protein [Hyphococcus luteus]|uniref:Uncharacterized protein n=1 Tax=Hyphococcus luteus TaxID=2058213 RepID=A0A2S7K8W5_9PROT|nr:DUF4339 domain-containing protein [Marinicaulis flavus]PQA88923.1 hypothetical protein CW354_02940 [Marinicaulis flavus]
MLAAENWCVKVQDKVYGPYTTQEMRNFALQGRLARWSLVAPAGGQSWREARSELVFANIFSTPAQANDTSPVSSDRAFGKRIDCDSIVNENAPKDQLTDYVPAKTVKAKRAARADHNGVSETGAANFIVIFDVVSAAASRVEAAMLGLGPAFRIADNVWHVTCELTAVGVRNAITPYLRGSESIFVVDATRGRSSWANYAPEPNAKITAAHFKSKQA